MSKYIQKEIDLVREMTRQTTSDENNPLEAVTRESILQFLTEADRNIHSRFLITRPTSHLFSAQSEITLVAGQNEYDLPSDAVNLGDVKLVEYRDSSAREYYPLIRVTLSKQREYRTTCGLQAYTLLGRKIIVIPTPGTGTLRVTYPVAPYTLDVRRGKISVTPQNDGTNYQTIVLEDDEHLSDTMFSSCSHISIVDFLGNIVRTGLVYTDYNSATRTITLVPTPISAGAIAAEQFVVLGERASSHSQLPIIAEAHRLRYAAYNVGRIAASSDVAFTLNDIQKLEAQTIEQLIRTWN